MASYGGYEAVREIARGGLHEVHAVTLPGETQRAFAVKTLVPSALIDPPQLEAAKASFLAGAREQQAVAAAPGVTHWAPIHDLAATPEGGAYYRTDLCARSLQQLFLGQVRLTPRAMHHVVRSIVDGLVELKAARGRAHGRLAPENVLLRQDGEVSQSSLLLTDPAPPDAPEARDEHGDLRALGELIYQLALHRPLRGTGVWPVPASKEWARLGRTAEAWRGLCNALLAPHLAPEGGLTLESVAQRLDALKPSPVRVPPRLIVAGLAVVLAVLGGVFGYGALHRAIVPTDVTGGWGLYCHAWDQWLGQFQNDVWRDEARRRAWQADERLRPIVERLDAAIRGGAELNPRVLADRPGATNEELADLQRDGDLRTRLGEDGQLQRRVRTVVEMVWGHEQPAAAPPAAPGLLWQVRESGVLSDLRRAADACAANGWGRQEQLLRRMLDEASGPRRNAALVIDAFLDLERSQRLVRALALREALFAPADRIAAAGTAGGDRYLSQFPAFLAAATAVPPAEVDDIRPVQLGEQLAASFDQLLADLQRMQDAAAALASAVESDWPKVHRSCLFTRSRTYAGQADPTWDLYRAWVVDVRSPSYHVNEALNPFRNAAWGAELERLLAESQAVAALEKPAVVQPRGGDFARRIAELQQRIASGGAADCCRECAPDLERAASEARRAYETLSGEVLAYRRTLETPSPAVAAAADRLRSLRDDARRKLSWIPEENATVRRTLEGRLDALLAGPPTELLTLVEQLGGPVGALEAFVQRDDIGPELQRRMDELARLVPEIDQHGSHDPRPQRRDELDTAAAALAFLRAAQDAAFADTAQASLEGITAAVPEGYWAQAYDASTRQTVHDVDERLRGTLEGLLQRLRSRRAAVEAASLLPEPLRALEAAKAPWQEAVAALLAEHPADDEALRAGATAVRERVVALDAALPRDAGVRWAGEPARTRRTGVLLAALRAPADDAQTQYVQWCARVGELDAQLRRAERLLTDAYGPDEAPPDGGATLAGLLAGWRQSPVFGEFTEVNEVRSLSDRAAAVLEMAASTERSGLVKAASEGGDRALMFAAWRGLGRLAGERPWPGTLEELRQEERIDRYLETAVERVEDAGRRAALQAEVRGEAQRRWGVALARLTSRDELAAASAMMAAFGVEESAIASLPAAGQYHYGLLRLQEQLDALRREVKEIERQREEQGEDATRAAKRAARDGRAEAIRAFVERVEALPADVRSRAEVQECLRHLSAIAAWRGPAGARGRGGRGGVGWTEQRSPRGERVTYARGGQTLEFVKVRADGAGGAKPVYVCTTEVSVGLFSMALAEAGRWGLQSPATLRGGGQMWRGPRSWAPFEAGVRPGAGWIFVDPTVSQPYAKAPAAPTADMPMNYVAPEDAAAAAVLLGCRLPTGGEWSAAKAAGAGGRWNLRDRTWEAQKQHTAALIAQGQRADWPDAGAFRPEGVEKREGPDATAGAEDDGVLWFAPVDADTDHTFRHIVGNVAEYVVDDRDAWGDAADQPAAMADALRRAGELVKDESRVRVLGASAISPPEAKADEPYPLPRRARGGFADVGFRLAFTAPSEQLEDVLDRFAAAGLYLPPR